MMMSLTRICGDVHNPDPDAAAPASRAAAQRYRSGADARLDVRHQRPARAARWRALRLARPAAARGGWHCARPRRGLDTGPLAGDHAAVVDWHGPYARRVRVGFVGCGRADVGAGGVRGGAVGVASALYSTM